MKTGKIECFAGISGDMLLGALIDCGVPQELFHKTAAALKIGAGLTIRSVDRSGIQATKVDVLADGHLAEAVHEHEQGQSHTHDHVHDHDHDHDHDHEHEHQSDHGHVHEHVHADHSHGRTWKQIRALIAEAGLPDAAMRLALRTFELLAHAEARIHGIAVEQVHFHEVGAVDTITDIVCASAGLAWLGVERWYASPVNTGSGFVQCAHGKFPVPAPATADLLKGIPTYSSGIEAELVTPTGAALLRALECSFESPVAFTARQIGYGAGTRNPTKFPNVVRISIGETAADRAASGFSQDRVTVLECAVDDASPQVLAHAMELALESGALDVMAMPVVMKKGRLGTLLTVLCAAGEAHALEAILFRETTTLGIRQREESRAILDRDFVTVDTIYGRIRIKTAAAAGLQLNVMPEYEDCRRAAREHGVALKLVMETALAAFSANSIAKTASA